MFSASINAAMGILWSCILWCLKAMGIKVALLYLWCIYLTYLLRVRAPEIKCTCGAKSPVLIRDLALAEDILTFTKLSSRARPNQRLVQAFDIDNAFTTFDDETHREFVTRAKHLLHRPDPPITSVIKLMRKCVVDETLRTRLRRNSVPLLPIVQVFCFRFVLLKFFASSHVDASSTSSILRITQLINSLWVASKCSCSPNLLVIDLMKNELRRELGLLFSPEDEMDNPLNILLPTYETLWRVVLRCFLEISFRKSKNTREWQGPFEGFLDNPTPKQFSERTGGSSVQDIVKEALRLYPPTRRIYRQETVDSEIVAIDVEYLQRMEEVWGADGKSFKPERWGALEAAGNASYKRAWMPFGRGSFDCPARNLAPIMIGVLVGIMNETFGSDDCFLDGQEWSVSNDEPLENGREAMEKQTSCANNTNTTTSKMYINISPRPS